MYNLNVFLININLNNPVKNIFSKIISEFLMGVAK